MYLPVSLHPLLHILLSFTALFSAMNTFASVCRNARDYNFPIHLGWTDSYFLSLLFNAGIRMKRVTVQRIGTQLQPGTQVIKYCLWNRAENIVRVCARVWLFAVNVRIPITMYAYTHMLKCLCCFLSQWTAVFSPINLNKLNVCSVSRWYST